MSSLPTLPEPKPEPAAEATPTAPKPGADPYADFKDFLPSGVDAKEYIRGTLQVRKQIDDNGGLDRVLNERARAQAYELAPQLAEELLRSPEGRKIAEKIVGARQREDAGEELAPEEKRLLDLADRTEKAEQRAAKAEELAQGSSVAILQGQIASGMEREFSAAMAEQPEAEDYADIIREAVGNEGRANPELIEPGWTKRRSLELYAKLSGASQKASARTATRGRATGSPGGGAAAKKDPTTLTREEARDMMAAILEGESG